MSAIFGRLVGNEHPLVASPYIMYLRKTLAVDDLLVVLKVSL